MYSKLLIFLIPFVLFSCNTKEETSNDSWIGGQIVNPKSDYVVILKEGVLLDTVSLDHNNFFMYHPENSEKGLYTIKHNEYQVFYLEPGDSLMLRVNTMDFDESISFTGTGAEKNNLLIDLFLRNEEDTEMMGDIYQLPPSQFLKKIDSLQRIRKKMVAGFTSENKASDDFKAIVEANLAYDYYSKKESYVAIHAENPSSYLDSLPPNYFDYRKKINLDNPSFRNYFSYTRFLNRYFDNLAHEKIDSATDYYDWNSYAHNKEKIILIDSLVKNDSIKNSLMRRAVRRYLLSTKDGVKSQEIVSLFAEISTNKNDLEALQALATYTVKLTPGNKIPDIQLVDTENLNRNLQNLIKKNSVIYFWTYESVNHYRDVHTKAAELHNKYPEYDFIGINTDRDYKKWKAIVLRNGFKTKDEYQIENLENAANELAIHTVNKAIIVGRDGKILDGNTSLFSSSIETLLVGYLNR
ncbi:TlpA family protein disulfide reductase [Jejudonia soesokkakensis]|uniref:TlpA family protein disulfide reductase n=1 Tax=Jejudonia soesokkakensis TaxID=1323432 RepID=A0ABW2MVF4_9FLAO